MTRNRRTVLATAMLAALTASAVLATQEMSTKEGMKCTACHDKAGSKLLTNKGKYYEYTGTMAGYDDLVRQHKKCTACHVKEPGSMKLTAKGDEAKAKGFTMKHVPEKAR